MADEPDRTQTSQAFKGTMRAWGRYLPAQLAVMRRSGRSIVSLTAPRRRK